MANAQDVTQAERVKNFIASVSRDELLYDPTIREPDKRFTEPQLPPNVSYSKKTIRFTIPAGRPLNISAILEGVKAQSVFLSMVDDPRYIQLYKGETNGEVARSTLYHYSDPLPYEQVYLLTTASKDTPGREADQPWWNNHPLGRPRPDGYKKKTVWETDDSRDPGVYPNVTVTWYHDGYEIKFEVID